MQVERNVGASRDERGGGGRISALSNGRLGERVLDGPGGEHRSPNHHSVLAACSGLLRASPLRDATDRRDSLEERSVSSINPTSLSAVVRLQALNCRSTVPPWPPRTSSARALHAGAVRAGGLRFSQLGAARRGGGTLGATPCHDQPSAERSLSGLFPHRLLWTPARSRALNGPPRCSTSSC